MKKEKVFLVQKLIDDFGGLTSMHQKTGVPIGTIQYWQRMGKIPEWRIKFIEDICQQFGLDLQKYENQDADGEVVPDPVPGEVPALEDHSVIDAEFEEVEDSFRDDNGAA